MPGSSLFALIDDITSLLDDVAVLSKVAMQKTTGVLGDDLALNAEQTAGVAAERELPVVWAVAKGSFINKLILVPSALAISAFAPGLILPLLMVGGLYLCYEGVEKVVHQLAHRSTRSEGAHAPTSAPAQAEAALITDLAAFERTRVAGAIRTDFILSAEIVVIALGTMATAKLAQQVIALSLIGFGLTVLVYGVVAAIVKLDDLGLRLIRTPGASRSIGRGILVAAPWLMKTLSVVGTVAMFMVGGGIIAHGAPPVEHFVEGIVQAVVAHDSPLAGALKTLLDAAVGGVAGALVLGAVTAGGAIVRAARSGAKVS